jgi:hypothetical protein
LGLPLPCHADGWAVLSSVTSTSSSFIMALPTSHAKTGAKRCAKRCSPAAWVWIRGRDLLGHLLGIVAGTPHLHLLERGRDESDGPRLQVFRAAGPKWKLIYALYSMPEWAELSKGYKAIMVADDDLHMTACTINRLLLRVLSRVQLRALLRALLSILLGVLPRVRNNACMALARLPSCSAWKLLRCCGGCKRHANRLLADCCRPHVRLARQLGQSLAVLAYVCMQGL